jgi:uncharacterized membrane protein YfcA
MPEFLSLDTLPSEFHPAFLILVFLVGGIASFINSLAGGGSTLTLPALIFMGVPPTIANGINRFGILFGNLASVGGLSKKGHLRKDILLKLFPIVAIGAIAGALAGVNISDHLFRILLAITLVWVVIAGRLRHGKKRIPHPEGEFKPSLKNYLAFLMIGFYGGFIQVGVGFWLIIALIWSTGLEIIKVNALKGSIAVIFIGISAAVFIANGKTIWLIALTQALGCFIGGWMGSHYQVKKGEGFIRGFISAISILMAFKLIWDII